MRVYVNMFVFSKLAYIEVQAWCGKKLASSVVQCCSCFIVLSCLVLGIFEPVNIVVIVIVLKVLYLFSSCVFL